MGISNRRKILKDNLVFAIDAANPRTNDTIVTNMVTGVTGSYVNGAVIDSNNKAFKFDGSSDYIYLPPTGNTTDENDPFTFEVTFRADVVASNDGIINFGAGGIDSNYRIFIRSSGQVWFRMGTSAIERRGTAGVIVVDEIITIHVAYDGSNLSTGVELFLNGNPTPSSAVGTGKPLTFTDEVYLGFATINSGPEYFIGTIFSAKKYNTRLTNAEILNDYNISKQRFQGEITDGLILNIDSRDKNSINGTSVSSSKTAIETTGTLTNMASDYRSGYDGKDFNFDGIDDYVEILHNSTLDFSSMGSFTLLSWIKIDTWESGGYAERIITKSNSATTAIQSWEWAIRNSDKSLTFRTQFDAVTDKVEEGTTALELGTWYHVVFTFDGAQATGSKGQFYINGVADTMKTSGWLVGSHIDIANVYDSGYSMKIGGLSTRIVNGKISTAKVYNRALTSLEVLQNHNVTKGGYSPEVITTDGLVSYWNSREKFGGVDGTSWYDRIGTNDGTVVSAPPFDGNDFDFDGVSDYIDIGSVAELEITGDLTVSLWMNPGAYGTTDAFLAYQGTAETEATNIIYYLALRTPGNIQSFHEYGAGQNVNSSHIFSAGVQLNTWTHLTLVRNTTTNTINLYINGTKLNDDFTGWTNPSGGTTATLRFAENQTGAHFNGRLNHIAIYDRALTEAEVRHNYNQTLIDFI